MARIEVRLRQVRYNGTVAMDPVIVEQFSSTLRRFAEDFVGVDAAVTVSTPKDSTSLLFEIEVNDG